MLTVLAAWTYSILARLWRKNSGDNADGWPHITSPHDIFSCCWSSASNRRGAMSEKTWQLRRGRTNCADDDWDVTNFELFRQRLENHSWL